MTYGKGGHLATRDSEGYSLLSFPASSFHNTKSLIEGGLVSSLFFDIMSQCHKLAHNVITAAALLLDTFFLVRSEQLSNKKHARHQSVVSWRGLFFTATAIHFLALTQLLLLSSSTR